MTTYLFNTNIVLCALILGGMVFYVTFMAPLIFIKLPAPTAGEFIREVFPWYFLVFAVLTLLSAILLFIGAFQWQSAVMLICAVFFIFSRQWLMPKINDYRIAIQDGESDAKIKFKNFHRLSVAINYIQLIAIFIIFIAIIN
ncbi:MAG: DUF4149 domain-containing protein [Pseudomonadota bacterium]